MHYICSSRNKLIHISIMMVQQVFPTASSQRKLAMAKKDHDRAMQGLRIVTRESELAIHLLASKALGPCRSLEPLSFPDLSDRTEHFVAQCNQTINRKSVELDVGTKRLSKLRNKLKRQVPDDLKSLTVFQVRSKNDIFFL